MELQAPDVAHEDKGQPGQEPPASTTELFPPVRLLGGKAVLIVDDDPDIRRTLGDVLEAEGYQVTEAADGVEALTHLHSGGEPNVILLDLMMPVMNGWQFCEELRDKPQFSSIPVVLLSAVNELDEDLTSMDVDERMSKPVGLDVLLDTVERMCRQS